MVEHKFISWDVRGIRTRFKNKQLEQVLENNADSISYQQVKADFEQLPNELQEIDDYTCYFASNEPPKTLGVGTYTKEKPVSVKKYFKTPDDLTKGRVLNLVFKDYEIYNVLVPSDKKDKIEFMNSLIEAVAEKKDKKIIILGNFNIAHKEVDVYDLAKLSSQEDRDLLDKLMDLGFKDSYRLLDDSTDSYSYWSSKSALANNNGLRFDYFFVSKSLADSVSASNILKDIDGSDHVPIELVIDL